MTLKYHQYLLVLHTVSSPDTILGDSLDALDGVGEGVALLDPAPVVVWIWKVGGAAVGRPRGQTAMGNWNRSVPVAAVVVGRPVLLEAWGVKTQRCTDMYSRVHCV